jgi:uncharacterized protein YqgC (DUF456 family)
VDATVLLMVIAFVLVVTGVAGMVLPAMPGPPLVLAGLCVAAWAEDFAYVGWGTISVLALLTLLAYAADFVAGALGAKKFGAGRRAVVGAALGALFGLFFGIPGIIIGPFLGAVLGELTDRKDLQAASRAGIGAWIGLVLGAAAKMAIVFTMIGIFLVMRLF